MIGPDAEGAGRARRLFRYIGGDEWHEYRAIMSVFADTFFAEFTPDDVAAQLAAAGIHLDPAVAGDRLERLRDWGNLTVSSSVGNPTDLADYYRRRNRYLITRAGQEVHGLVEGVLGRVDEVRDVSTGRLRSLLGALTALDELVGAHGDDEATLDSGRLDPGRVADLVRAVFDPHVAFTDEISQFFASINQWQSRYDLDPDEFRFFAEVLVGYVTERLDEIERLARPIGRRLESLAPKVPTIVHVARGGLAARVERAGLDDRIHVTRSTGSDEVDWDRLARWFVTAAAGPSRIDRLTRDAVAAIRTLTLNLTRLSRVGIGAASRRADFLRLAAAFHSAEPDQVPLLAAAAFGLHSARHYGLLADDDGDPVSSLTSWRDAPRARVPISLRERGDTTNRGRATPIADRSAQQEMVRRRREHERRARERVDAELLAVGALDGAELSTPAMWRLQQLLGRSTHGGGTGTARSDERRGVDGAVACVVRRRPGTRTVVRCPEGVLSLLDLDITIEPAGVTTDATSDVPANMPADAVAGGADG